VSPPSRKPVQLQLRHVGPVGSRDRDTLSNLPRALYGALENEAVLLGISLSNRTCGALRRECYPV